MNDKQIGILTATASGVVAFGLSGLIVGWNLGGEASCVIGYVIGSVIGAIAGNRLGRINWSESMDRT